ncbi:hypothetical protein CXG81DRAFT_27147 [Caulochytrium protostelioides]|uniref:Uncharacterized protein n=1 Tax=Caulochytrium protostelioides TaxID=1555241 RepID=A0A4P9X4V1_9FUNG|nr:hypothetical protein CXG81DRAFT_27147 [Caulochytrium protostelioides]|eukprot:RKP00113.1 hypothetical protein CXG81DRAFT_27147 [Caulochytrium protostelioides]
MPSDAEGVSVGSADDTSSDDTTSVVRVPAKRRRPDRAEKPKRRLDETETVVKAALLKYLQGKDRRRVRDAIRARVKVFFQRYHIASIALSGLLKRCFDGIGDAKYAQLPGLTNHNFYKQLMLGGAGATKPDPYVRDYYRDYPLLAARSQRHLGDSNIDVAGVIKYEAYLRSHHRLSFEARVKQYVRVFQTANGLMDPHHLWMLYWICGWKPRQDLPAVTRSPLMEQTGAARCRVLGIAVNKQAPVRLQAC